MKRFLALFLALLLIGGSALAAGKESAGEQPEGTAPTASPVPEEEPEVTAAPAEEDHRVSYLGKVFAEPDAEYVDMGDVGVRDWNAFYAFLDSLPNLKSVDMFSTRIHKDTIEKLHDRYPGVHFGMTMLVAEHVIRTDQTAFSTLHNKHSETHTSEDFSILKYCDNLLALDLGHNQIDDISFLYSMPNLRVLIIAINKVTDITPLASLKDLEYAEIFNNQITDLSPLEGLTHLIDLDIAFNNIEDYSPIYGLKSIRRLWMYNANNRRISDPVPQEVVDRLHQELPDAKIDAVHYPTTGGWREHPHYDVIAKIFKTSTYIPFEDSFPMEEEEIIP